MLIIRNQRRERRLFAGIFASQEDESGQHAVDAGDLFHPVEHWIIWHVALEVDRNSARDERQDRLQIAALAVQPQLLAQRLDEPRALLLIPPRVKSCTKF